MSVTLTNEEKTAVLRQMASHWQNKSWRQCADLFTEGGVLQSMMKDPIVGREAFYERMTQLATPNKSVKLHIHRIGVIDGAVFHEREDEVIIDGVGRRVPVVGVLEFEGPLISLWRDYYDRGQLMWAQRKAEQVAPVPFAAPGEVQGVNHG
ncbi:MAG: nuclear transport factor 2 family protein [Leptospiraceae bacterium]|nr:nuclear transport factor 2 family protein [Leptospiraceae bacterium]